MFRKPKKDFDDTSFSSGANDATDRVHIKKGFRDDDVDWGRIFQEMENPKIDEASGEEYINVSPVEMAAIDKVSELFRGFRVPENPELPLSKRVEQDVRFKRFLERQFPSPEK